MYHWTEIFLETINTNNSNKRHDAHKGPVLINWQHGLDTVSTLKRLVCIVPASKVMCVCEWGEPILKHFHQWCYSATSSVLSGWSASLTMVIQREKKKLRIEQKRQLWHCFQLAIHCHFSTTGYWIIPQVKACPLNLLFFLLVWRLNAFKEHWCILKEKNVRLWWMSVTRKNKALQRKCLCFKVNIKSCRAETVS